MIVASEPSTYNSKEWELIEKNHCLMVEKDGKAQLEKLEYPQECKCLSSEHFILPCHGHSDRKTFFATIWLISGPKAVLHHCDP